MTNLDDYKFMSLMKLLNTLYHLKVIPRDMWLHAHWAKWNYGRVKFK